MGLKQRPYIEKATALGGVYLYALHKPEFIARLKDAIPLTGRDYESGLQRWYISQAYAERATDLFLAFWPAAKLYTNPAAGSQQTHRQQASGQGQWFRMGGSGYATGNGQQATWSPPQMSRTGPYAILQVASDACPEVIRAAYKALALKHHPDKGGDASEMLRVNQAFEELKKAGRA